MSRRPIILNPFEDDDDNQSESNRNGRAGRQRRGRRDDEPKRRRLWPYLLLLLLLLIAFLPNLLGMTGLHQKAINYFADDFNGTITIEKASLGWLQPIQLTNISAVDVEGNDLFKAASITSAKPLWELAKASDLGEINVVAPVAYIHLRPDGSNLEDAIANYMAPTENDPNQMAEGEPSENSLPKVAINVTDGRALITSSTDTQSWNIDGLNAVARTQTGSAPLVIEADYQVTPIRVDAGGQIQLQNPGKMAINAQVDPGENNLVFAAIEVALAAADAPVSIAGPILQRFLGPMQAEGLLSGSLQSQINLNSQAMRVDLTNLSVNSFGLSAPSLIGSDNVFVQSVTANGTMELSPDIIASKELKLDSDFGNVTSNGRFDVKQLTNLAAGGALLDTPFRMDGEIDLAKLLRMLPSTLQLHQDLTVDSGTVTFQAGSNVEEGIPKLIMNLDMANLKARRGNQNIIWQPLRIITTVSQSPAGLIIDDASLESDFLVVKGSANYETGTVRAKGDLAQLMESVGQFADLAGMQLAGELDGTFGWQTNPANAAMAKPILISGKFEVTNPVVKYPNMPVWQQPKVTIGVTGAGLAGSDPQTSQSTLQLDQGGIQVDIGSEQAIATLNQPLQNAFSDVWNLDCQLKGDLNGWVRHIQNFVDIGDVQAAGPVNLTCQAAYQGNLIQLSNIEYEVQQLGFNGYGLQIRDPKAYGTGVVTYDLSTGGVSIPDLILNSSSISARGQEVSIAFAPDMQIAGPIAFRADLNRVADWLQLSPNPDSVRWYGSVEGNVQLATNENGIGGTFASTITDLVAGQHVVVDGVGSSNGNPVTAASSKTAWSELLREPKVELASGMTLASDFNAIGFENLTVASSALNVKATGTVSQLADAMVTNIQGTWNPDWQKVNSILGAYTGDLVLLAGSGEQPFTVRGPLFETSINSNQNAQPTSWLPASLQATTSVRWDQGKVLDVPIGASQIDIDFQNSFGRLQTAGIPFSGGVVRFAPGIDMRGSEPVVLMDQTRVIDNLTLTETTARQWLKFIAPLAADATSAQGNVTVDVRSLKMPVFNPTTMDAQGAIRLNNVVIGAGPLADQLLGTINQLRTIIKPNAGPARDRSTWLQMAEQTIPIMVRDEKVFHEGVTFTHKDTTVRTKGSVGFDQSLNMIAEIPIADDWIADQPYLAGLKGQSLSIPIRGTVTKPQLDKRAIQQFSTQLAKQAAGSAINKVIGDKLAPKLGDVQNQINNKLNDELNSFQQKLGGRLGDALLGGGNQPPADGSTPATNNGQPSGTDLLKGIGNLFGK